MRISKIKNFNRNDLATMFEELNFKRGAEIGVRNGNYTIVLCQIKSLEKLYAVDPWDLVYGDRQTHADGIKLLNSRYEKAKKRLAEYPVCEIIKKTSLEAVRNIPYESLDFVYIDGSHVFDYVMTDLIEWGKRVKKGGIISGDDYKLHRFGDVITPVNTYVNAHKIATLNIIIPKLDDEYPTPNWWFTKP